MDETKRAILEAGEEAVERAAPKSKQPRFTMDQQGQAIFMRWLRSMALEELKVPPYRPDSRERDDWLSIAWMLEPHIAGVMNSVTLIDSNRGWEFIGGRNQVSRFTGIWHSAEGGKGWRVFARKCSNSFWALDLGTLVELGRDGKYGPTRALWHLDTTRCRMTGKIDKPLEYNPAGKAKQEWGPADFLHCNSMPSLREEMLGLGFSAVSRAIETVRLLYAVMCHDQEMVMARAPKGLLLLQGIDQGQWLESLEQREDDLDSLQRRYYGGVQVLANSGMGEIDAKLVALSQLPQNFDQRVFIDLSMYAIALAFGYDPREFWPVSSGALGTATETQTQHVKATAKGGMDFSLAFQEQLQSAIPETLHFEFEQRDDVGELTTAQLRLAKLDVITKAYEAGALNPEGPLVNRNEARQLMVDEGIIPAEWTEAEEDVKATDTDEQDLDRSMQLDSVQRCARRWPNEQIVRYSWPAGTTRVIYDPAKRRRVFPVQRQNEDEGEILFQSDDGEVVITEKDVDRAIADFNRRIPEYAGLLEAEPEEEA